MSIKTEVREITPEEAKTILERNHDKQRKLNRARVARFAKDIVLNDWQFNGEPIIIADDGTLLDGQHRLNAVIEADKPIKTLVVEGIPKETEDGEDIFAYINSENRTNADALYIKGYNEWPANEVVKLLKLVDAFNRRKLHTQTNGRKFSNHEIVEYAEMYDKQELHDTIARAHTFRERCPALSLELYLLLAWLEHRVPKMKEFIEELTQCDDGKEGSPVSAYLRLLDSLTRRKVGGAAGNKARWIGLFTAFDKYVKGVETHNIRPGLTLPYPNDYDDYES